MSVKLRHKKIILDTIWPDGIRTRRYMPDLAIAKRLDLRIKASRVDGSWQHLRQTLGHNPADTSPMGNLADLISRYKTEYCEPNNRSMATKEVRLKAIVRLLGSVPIVNLSPIHVTTYIARRRREGVKPATINRELSVLRHMSAWALENGITTENRLAGSKPLKEERWEGRLPTQEAIDAIMAQLQQQVKPFFSFLYETGCRREEALTLRYQDVDREKGIITFHTTKAGRPRSIVPTDLALEAVNSMPPMPGMENVFYNPITLRRWHDCGRAWDIARRKAGYSWVRVHDLRRFFGIRLAESGCPMHSIQVALGHSSVAMTEKYYAKFSPIWAGKTAREYLEKVRTA